MWYTYNEPLFFQCEASYVLYVYAAKYYHMQVIVCMDTNTQLVTERANDL